MGDHLPKLGIRRHRAEGPLAALRCRETRPTQGAQKGCRQACPQALAREHGPGLVGKTVQGTYTTTGDTYTDTWEWNFVLENPPPPGVAQRR